MFVILFKSRLSEQAGEDYYATEERMQERVRAIAGSDPVEVKHYTGEDGERLAVMMWEDEETLDKWRCDPEHQVAQRLGRKQWYSAYELTVAEVVRTSAHDHGSPAAAAEEPR
ncbi:antibiotic biosynthesis monooxygenase family protein [Streptomyces echinatus]|uniref:Heme-degrading monooxygenase HmoA n=1 Tax=Streptomyces echinatus TaxID=67293 RepID=A0A7W9UVV7_9ACTN|nr:antibiotic biosynthesis monooxygenase [Streptomyces echinatus]MBB5932069.1 heme-degrading monooxygenase HmoA [Streptomyces echinatus]